MTSAAIATGRVRLRAKAADPRSAAFALAFAGVAVVGCLDGGYYERSWAWIGLALAAAAGLRLSLGDEYPDRRGFVVLAALAGLASWTLLSAFWGIAGTEAVREAGRCAVYLAGFSAFVVVARPSNARALLAGVLCAGTFLAGLALAEKLVSPPPPDPFQGTLLYGPVGYANALGIIAAVGLVLAIGLLVETGTQRARAALVVAAFTCGTALALTSSRGAWLATLAGLLVLAGLRASKRGLLGLGLAVTLACVAIAPFAAPSVSMGDRPAYWKAAAAEASAHPFVGSGAGSFDDFWLDHRTIGAFVQDAHSLYLETAAELGLVGLALLGCTLLVPLSTAITRRRQPLVPVAAAAYLTFLVHAGLDWDWEMPATTLAGLACAAALIGNARKPLTRN
ncbi:MAG TPA: O-antigen ligase family protein [Gaiellaceae bacterium]|nr:O-antigen ligase family protein [Gaiellaceae bacterium]